MPHAATNIIDAIQTLLSGATSAGTNVFIERKDYSFDNDILPAISINYGDEKIVSNHYPSVDIEHDFNITMIVSGTVTEDTTTEDLYTLRKEVIDLMLSDITLGGSLNVINITQGDVGPIDSGSGEYIFKAITQVFTVLYRRPWNQA